MTQSMRLIKSAMREAPVWCLFFALSAVSRYAAAQVELTELLPLNFGVMAITSNQTVSTLTIPRGGGDSSVIGDLVDVETGTPGRYQISDLPPTTSVEVDISVALMSAGGTGIPEPISVDQFEFGSVLTNEQGEAEFQLGANFSTSGNGGTYEDASYSGTAEVNLTYWEPVAESFVSVRRDLDIIGEVRTSLALEELDALRFGTLFARATAGDRASLTLSPNGQAAVSNQGDARIVALSEASPGVFAVTGAAPNRRLMIEVQQSDVLLRLTTDPAELHFVLSDLVTSPASSGVTDEAGRLEFGVGGTLSTQLSAGTQVYPSGTYEGSYSVSISY